MGLHTTGDTGNPGPRLPLSTLAVLARLAAIGVIILAVVAGYAYVGGWLSPERLSPGHFTSTFEQANGIYPGFRRNHAKGLCLVGSFESNGQGARLSKAAVFAPGRIPVIGRFSFAGGQPYAADAPTTVRALGLRFALPDGEEWRTAMIDLPLFPFRTPDAFYEQLVASRSDPATGKPDPDKMKAFLAVHPETARVLDVIRAQPVASGFDNIAYNGLNAFRFVDGTGK